MPERCNIGGDEWTGEHSSIPQCLETPTVRYQPKADKNCPNPDEWGLRCAKHAKWLDATYCRIEKLKEVAGER